MKKISLLLFIILTAFVAQAQTDDSPEIVRTQGQAQVYWAQDRETRSQAKDRALQKATINALEKAFGVVVVQGNATYVENVQTGEKVETRSTFNMIGNTVVKGEVVEVLDKDFEKITGYETRNGKRVERIDFKCTVTLNAKEIQEPKADIKTFPLACNTSTRCQTTMFKSGDDFFLYFQSPVSGYLTVFLDDGTQANRLLPYMQMPQGAEYESAMPIEADKEYIFFSDAKEHNYFENPYFQEDTYELYASKPQELNRLFIIFSENLLKKPSLKDDFRDQSERKYLKEGYLVPHNTDSESFQRWLIENRYVRNDLQVEIIDISIEQ